MILDNSTWISVKEFAGLWSVVNVESSHPAESSENTSICANIRKYVPIDCLWWMFSQPHFEEGAIKIHVISIASICKFIISQRRLDE